MAGNSVVVLHNLADEDDYERLRTVDPASLDFVPSYDIHVATAREEYDAIVKALRSEGFRTRVMNLENSLSKLHRLVTRNIPDVVFNLVESFHDEASLESAVAGFFDLFRVPYTGATAFCLSLCRRKGLTKQILLQHSIPTPKFRLIDTAHIERRHGLSYPVIVKPSRQDASSGVERPSVVYDYAQLRRQLDRVFSGFGPPVLLEEFIEGREMHVSVFGNNPAEVLPIEEFDFSELPGDHPPLITYEIKWNPLSPAYHRVHSICPARISRRTGELVRTQALRAYAATYCRDYARIDMRLGGDGVPYVLEVNPNPDLTEGVSFMESAEKAGIPFSRTLRRIVEFALERRH